MRRKLSIKQERVYRLCSGEHEGLSTAEAALKMGITPQAVNRLLDRAKAACPQLFPLLTKQEAKVKAWLSLGYSNSEIANRLQVSLGRVSQIIGSICEKQGTVHTQPVKLIRYESWMDSQIRRKF